MDDDEKLILEISKEIESFGIYVSITVHASIANMRKESGLNLYVDSKYEEFNKFCRVIFTNDHVEFRRLENKAYSYMLFGYYNPEFPDNLYEQIKIAFSDAKARRDKNDEK